MNYLDKIGYSQGGLLSRAILEAFPNHCVKHFISLSSPQAGQYGSKYFFCAIFVAFFVTKLLSAAFLHLIFPNLVAQTAYQLFYSFVGQHTSVGNYWKDPQRIELYLQYSSFLPYVNNELESINSTRFREGILKLELMVLIGGPDDGVITPWESRFVAYNFVFEILIKNDT